MKLSDIARKLNPNYDSLSVLDKADVLDAITLALAYDLLDCNDETNTVSERGVK